MTPIVIPRDNANDDSVIVGEFLVPNGTQVSAGDSIAEIETSKVNFTIESPAEGYIQFQCQEGDEVEVGATFATLNDKQPSRATALENAPEKLNNNSSPGEPVFSKKARTLLQASPIPPDDLSASGFVTSTDILKHSPVSAPPHPKTKKNSTAKPTWTGTKSYIAADLFRYDRQNGKMATFKNFLCSPGFRISSLYRIGRFTRSHFFLKKTIHPFLSLIYRWQIHRFGLRIPFDTEIGPGLYIGHWGGTWINAGVTIGSNCNLGQNVSIGSAGPDAKKGHPTIGNNVFIGPGAAISGPIIIGNDVLISANTFVLDDALDNSCLMGVPAKTVHMRGSNKFINHQIDLHFVQNGT